MSTNDADQSLPGCARSNAESGLVSHADSNRHHLGPIFSL